MYANIPVAAATFSSYHINIPAMPWQLYLCKFPSQIRKIFHLSALFSFANFLFNFFVLCSLWFGFPFRLFFYLWQLIWWSGRGYSYTNQFHYIEAKINWNKGQGSFSSSIQTDRQTVPEQDSKFSSRAGTGAGQLYLKDSSAAPLHGNTQLAPLPVREQVYLLLPILFQVQTRCLQLN